jgi:hypothetical protein
MKHKLLNGDLKMISDYDRRILTEVGREYILYLTMESKYLKENISFKEHVILCGQVKRLTYEEVITLTITEDIRAFESGFGKFLKYSIAAVAGLMGGIGGPPVAMFILYLYRKATDTCERSCYRKLPLSKERKLCKYNCQLAAAKRITNQIKSEISKCSNFSHPEKCEKKLQGEYIKWAKRVQELIYKINQVRADVEEDHRKQVEKNLAKRAKQLRAGIELSKDQLINFISENKTLRKNLPFKRHLELYKVCQQIEEFDKSQHEVEPIKIDPKKEKWLRIVLYMGLWPLPVPFFNDVVNYMVKKYSFGCAGKCINQNKMSKKLCYTQCAYLGAKYAVNVLNKQLAKCPKAKEPVKCKKSIYDLLSDWKQREVERKIKFESTVRSEIAAAKIRNTKGRQQGND